MALVLDGGGSITGLAAGGLPDVSVTRSDLACGVVGNGPAFSASNSSAISVPTSTYTLCTLSNEQFDTNGCFNNTGSTVNGIPAYAFKPNVAGYYQLNVGVQYSGTTYNNYWIGNIYANGTRIWEAVGSGAPAQYTWVYLPTILYANGTTDYFQAYCWQGQGGTQNMGCNFTGALIRAA